MATISYPTAEAAVKATVANLRLRTEMLLAFRFDETDRWQALAGEVREQAQAMADAYTWTQPRLHNAIVQFIGGLEAAREAASLQQRNGDVQMLIENISRQAEGL